MKKIIATLFRSLVIFILELEILKQVCSKQ